jgi:glyoxalase family protein
MKDFSEATMPGIHHVTAISGDPVKNLRFYNRDLGLRFVKKTVNFDDPSTYHFYFGDEVGRPGTILTFFPWTNAATGQRGVGEASQTAFRVPARSLGYWTDRFIEKGISHRAPEKRFGETILPFTDQDETALALVGVANAESEPGWSNGGRPLRACDPRSARRNPAARQRTEDRSDLDRCLWLPRDWP